jgi:hypothetical protein
MAKVSADHSGLLTLIFLLLTMATGAYLHQAVAPLTTQHILDFELAQDTTAVAAILNQLNANQLHELMRKSLYIDFAFIPCYTGLLICATRWLAKLSRHELMIRAASIVALLMVIAALADVVENWALLQTLKGPIDEWKVELSYNAAFTKFSLIILTLLFGVGCLFMAILQRAPVETVALKTN